MSQGGTISYFDVDGLGSVVATNDTAGNVTHSALFDAWGTERVTTGTRFHPFTYTGREVGEAASLFYRARYYQPSVGRFTQEDPLRYLTDTNPYRAVLNQPVQLNDPLGLWGAEAHDSLIMYALWDRVDSYEIAMIQWGSRDLDSVFENQLPGHAYMHSMRGPWQLARTALRKRDEFIRSRLLSARCAARHGRITDALKAFGEAIHPIMDSYSPVHAHPDGSPRAWPSLLAPFHGDPSFSSEESIDKIPWSTYEVTRERIWDAYQFVFR